MIMTIYCIIRITTGEPVSTNALTHTHTHPHRRTHRKTHTRRQCDGALLEAHGYFMKQRQPLEYARNSKKRLRRRALVTVRHQFVLDKHDTYSVPFPLLL